MGLILTHRPITLVYYIGPGELRGEREALVKMKINIPGGTMVRKYICCIRPSNTCKTFENSEKAGEMNILQTRDDPYVAPFRVKIWNLGG